MALDIDNKAVAKAMDIPPTLLQAIHDGDTEALSGVARTQLAFLMETMTKRCADPDMPAGVVNGFLEILRKMATTDKSAGDGGGTGPKVVINISRAKDREEKIVIDGTEALESH